MPFRLNKEYQKEKKLRKTRERLNTALSSDKLMIGVSLGLFDVFIAGALDFFLSITT
jgi:hypothetical protein